MLSLALPLAVSVLLATDLETTVETLFAPLVEKDAVGVTVGLRTEDRTIVRGFGRVRIGEDAAPDGDTLYEIGSVTKVFTGLLLADAIERGRASLDDPIERHVAEGVTVCDDEEPILLRHLVTHTSGLPRLPQNMAPQSLADPYADYDARALHAFLSDYVLESAPGERYAYSNLGTGLLGHLMARANGAESYEEALRERILLPLGLTDTAVTLSEAQRERFAEAATSASDAVKPWGFGALAGCGAIRSSVNDLLRFGAAQLGGTESPVAPAIRRSHEVLFEGPPAVAYGWHVADGGRTLWHNGQTGGYHGWLSVDVDARIVVAVLSNGGAGARIDAAANALMTAARE